MFEVVMFLIENYMDNGVNLMPDKESVTAELEKIGFHKWEIDRALDWLDGLERMQKGHTIEAGLSGLSMRHYLACEAQQLGVDGIGFLAYLEQVGVLDAATKEVVIDRLMALDKQEVDVARIQWVALVALYNQPQKKQALALLQDLILSDAFSQLH
jgi:Smg protein